MRKFAIIAFAVLYPILVLSVSAKRSNDWAVRQADVFFAKSTSGSSSPVMSKAVESDTNLPQKKRVEAEYVIEAPQETVFIPIQTGQSVFLPDLHLRSALSSPRVSSRAPPSYS
jgi:hypothetical protein